MVEDISLFFDEDKIIEKLKTRTGNIHNTKVTVSILPSLLPKLSSILEQQVTGILNFVNDDVVTLTELLNMLDIEHTVCQEKSNRGMCCLDATKLKKFVDVDSVVILKNSR